jgi:hypothetical protein
MISDELDSAGSARDDLGLAPIGGAEFFEQLGVHADTDNKTSVESDGTIRISRSAIAGASRQRP